MNLCVIPARGGSKRIPKKNIKNFFGKPLISYSIEAAKATGLFNRIVVSTDDEEIAEISRQYGAETPFIRPSNISDDFTGLTSVIDHAVDFLENLGEKFDYVCTIYATAPFIKSKYLIEGYEALKNSDAINAFASTSMPFPIQRTFKIDSKGRCKMFSPEYYNFRSQDLEAAYQDASQFCWTNRNRQFQNENKVVFSEISIPIIIPRNLVQDIDTYEDWQQAEFLFAAHQNVFNIDNE